MVEVLARELSEVQVAIAVTIAAVHSVVAVAGHQGAVEVLAEMIESIVREWPLSVAAMDAGTVEEAGIVMMATVGEAAEMMAHGTEILATTDDTSSGHSHVVEDFHGVLS